MKCPNCQSTELIDVQGQKFCLSCGFLIPHGAAAISETTIKKRGVGRPKSPRLDRPTPPAPPVDHSAIELDVHDVPDSGVAPEGVKHFDVIRSSRSRVKAATSSRVEPVPSARAMKLSLHYPGSGWIRQLSEQSAYAYGLPAAIWFGASVAAGAWAYRLAPWRGLPLSLRQVAWLAAGLLLAWAAAILASWGQAAIMYGQIRRTDHRSLPFGQWSGPALAAAGPASIINAMAVAGFTVLLAGSLGLINLVRLTSSAPVWTVVGVLAAGYMAIIYLVLALLLWRRLAVALVVLAGSTGAQAARQSLAWVSAHPELVTIEIYEACLWIVGWAILAVAIYYLRLETLEIALAGSAGAATVVALVQQLRSAGWQQATYYQLATASEGARRAQLLGGRQPERVGPGRIVAFVAVLVVIVVLAGGLVILQPDLLAWR